MDYIDTNKTGTWPSKSNIDCLWCCHSFENAPFGIPTRKDGDTFTMFGNFCCAECAAAYNFDSRISGDEMWERYSLLNMIYSTDSREIKIKCPVRLFQGSRDSDVPVTVPISIMNKIQSKNVKFTLVKDIDHRFSTDKCLKLVSEAVEELTLANN